MKNETKNYYEPSQCFAPIGSAEYAAWIFSLPESLRKIVLQENDRKKAANIGKK